MKCPICGETNLEKESVPSTYKWNKGLPETYVAKDWIYYICSRCFELKGKGNERRGFCIFVFLKDQTFSWDNPKECWTDLNLPLNPSRRFPDR